MLCLRRSELELKLSFSERELTLIKQERDRFERQATHLTQKYKAVDVAIYEQLQAEHAQLKQQLADVQAELAGRQELAQQQVATEKAAAQKAAQSRQSTEHPTSWTPNDAAGHRLCTSVAAHPPVLLHVCDWLLCVAGGCTSTSTQLSVCVRVCA